MDLELAACTNDRKLYVVTSLEECENRTRGVRKQETGLLISYTRPHGRVLKATVSRWIKTMLVQAGMDMKIFTPHSTRAASSSEVSEAKVPLETIMETAGWFKSSTFREFYSTPVHTVGEFAILNSNTN